MTEVSAEGMTADEVKGWRRIERSRLIAAREKRDAATLEASPACYAGQLEPDDLGERRD